MQKRRFTACKVIFIVSVVEFLLSKFYIYGKMRKAFIYFKNRGFKANE